MSLIITGHANHVGTQVLIIEGRGRDSAEIGRCQAADSKAIHDFLRAHLPCGTLDRLAVRLAGNGLDHLIGSDRLAEWANTNDVRAALADRIKELDKESK